MIAFLKQLHLLPIKKSSFVLILIEAIFLLVIWFPNLTAILSFTPYLANAGTLQSKLLKNGIFIDVAKYYACAKIAATEPDKIWDPTVQQNWFKNYLNIPPSVDLFATDRLSPAQYTPPSIVMFMPLSCLPLNQAISIWEILSFLFMLICVTILLKQSFKYTAVQSLFWWLIVLAAAPVTVNFLYGQVNGVLAGLLAVFLLTWQKKNNLPASICFALTVVIKPHRALVMLIMLLAARKFRLLLMSILICIIIMAGIIAVLGIGPILKYPAQVILMETALDRYQMPAPTTLVVGLLGPIGIICGREAARLASLPALSICLAGMYYIWRKAVRAGNHSYDFAYASTFLLNLICGPHEHFYDLALLSVVWACTVPSINIKNISNIKQHSLRFWCYLFLLFPAITWGIYLSTPVKGNFGAWHLPLLILMFFLSLYNFRRTIRS